MDVDRGSRGKGRIYMIDVRAAEPGSELHYTGMIGGGRGVPINRAATLVTDP